MRNVLQDRYKRLVELYIRAKDRHQPHLMDSVFAQDAILEMELNTDTIEFPSQTVGLSNITDTLVKQFHQRFDNVYTVCVSDSAKVVNEVMSCSWLVGMTESESGALRIGYGRYHWKFATHAQSAETYVQGLHIIINTMSALPANTSHSVLSWLNGLPQTWVSVEDMTKSAPPITTIQDFLNTEWQIE